MERRIRWLGVVFILCFALLFLQLNDWQLLRAQSLQSNPNQPPPTNVDVFNQQRGLIITSDFQVIAESCNAATPTCPDPAPKGDWYRYYPDPNLFADVTGYWDVTAHAATGLEGEYSNYLGLHESPVETFSDLLTQHEETNDIVTTISYKLQRAAEQALAGRQGAVVAIDPRTGAILAMFGNPTFDPNGLSTFDAKKANDYYNSLDPDSGSSPLVNAATADLHPPGSTFKIIDTAAIYDHDPSLASMFYPPETSIDLLGGRTLQNYGGESCPAGGGGLAQILAYSCDTAFAQIGITLGASTLVQEAQDFGFNSTPPLDLPTDVYAAQIPAAPQISYENYLAYSAIGQYDDAASALEMALVAAGVADKGTIMTPHLLDHVLNQQGQVVYSYTPKAWKQATSAATAFQERRLLVGPTSYGTLAGVLSPAELGGIVVGGKTGTAEIVDSTTENDCGGYDWVTAFGPDGSGQTPDIAVAAWVSGAGYGSICGGTGAAVAGPVVQQVLRAAFGLS
jgi:penicillin-binding protein A